MQTAKRLHENRLHSAKRQRNANQNHNETPLNTYQNGYHLKKKANVHEDVEKKESLVHRWWECKLVQLLWKTAWRFLKKNENRTTT